MYFSKLICIEQMLQNEIKFPELLASFLVCLGIRRAVASRADTAGPHSSVSIIGIYHYHRLTEVMTPPLFAIYFLIKITKSIKKKGGADKKSYDLENQH